MHSKAVEPIIERLQFLNWPTGRGFLGFPLSAISQSYATMWGNLSKTFPPQPGAATSMQLNVLAGRLLAVPVLLFNLVFYPFFKDKRLNPRLTALVAVLKMPFPLFPPDTQSGLNESLARLTQYKGKNGYNESFEEATKSICRWLYQVPDRKRSDPVMLYIHGGAFKVKIYKQHITHVRDICEHLSAYRLSAIAIDYGLSPKYRYPSQLLECVDAYRALEKTCDRIIVAGDSAGGNLACALVLWLKQNHNTERLHGFYINSPWVELYNQRVGSWIKNQPTDFLNGNAIDISGGKYIGDNKFLSDILAQPCLASATDWQGAVPKNSLLVYGDCEIFADQCRNLAETTGISCVYLVKGGPHCSNIAFERRGETDMFIFKEMSKWLQL